MGQTKSATFGTIEIKKFLSKRAHLCYDWNTGENRTSIRGF